MFFFFTNLSQCLKTTLFDETRFVFLRFSPFNCFHFSSTFLYLFLIILFFFSILQCSKKRSLKKYTFFLTDNLLFFHFVFKYSLFRQNFFLTFQRNFTFFYNFDFLSFFLTTLILSWFYHILLFFTNPS